MKKNVILDCDNTFGLPDCPVDDGLALLYLLGNPNVKLLGITTTYGNSSVDVTYENTKQMLKELGRNDIPVLRGSAYPGNGYSDASRFLVDQVNGQTDHISILSIGALTNLNDAFNIDNDFFDKVDEIVLMGGITEPLVLNGVNLDELNFSCDPQAAYCVLTHAKNLSVISGNNCLPAYISHHDYKNNLLGSGYPIGDYIYDKTKNWFDFKVKKFDLAGFYIWDVIAAAYLWEKRFFHDNAYRSRITVEDLKKGYLGDTQNPTTHQVNLPTICNWELLTAEIYKSWFRVNFPRQN